MSERREWWTCPSHFCQHSTQVEADYCSISPDHIHVREVLPGDDVTVRVSGDWINISEYVDLEEQHAALVAAARAVVADHERLCSTWQKCSHDVMINRLRKALEQETNE